MASGSRLCDGVRTTSKKEPRAAPDSVRLVITSTPAWGHSRVRKGTGMPLLG